MLAEVYVSASWKLPSRQLVCALPHFFVVLSSIALWDYRYDGQAVALVVKRTTGAVVREGRACAERVAWVLEEGWLEP